jgi:hypothetical protein
MKKFSRQRLMDALIKFEVEKFDERSLERASDLIK